MLCVGNIHVERTEPALGEQRFSSAAKMWHLGMGAGGMVGMGRWLGWILEVFSNLNDSMIQWCLKCSHPTAQ